MFCKSIFSKALKSFSDNAVKFIAISQTCKILINLSQYYHCCECTKYFNKSKMVKETEVFEQVL